MSDSLRPHGLQHTRLPGPSPSPGSCLNSYPLSQWCHPTISSSVTPFSSSLQSFPASRSFSMSWLFLFCYLDPNSCHCGILATQGRFSGAGCWSGLPPSCADYAGFLPLAWLTNAPSLTTCWGLAPSWKCASCSNLWLCLVAGCLFPFSLIGVFNVYFHQVLAIEWFKWQESFYAASPTY